MIKIQKLTTTGLIVNRVISRSLGLVERMQQFILEELLALKGRVARQREKETEKATAEMLGENNESLSESLEEILEDSQGN